MKSADHKTLANYLTRKYLFELSFVKQEAFRIGNIIPDRIPLTYLRGFFTYKRFCGHNYLNSQKRVKCLMTKLESAKFNNIFDFLRLGILTHYVADAFTFPHTQDFTGNTREHITYEQELHELLEHKNLEWDMYRSHEMIRGGQNLWAYYESMHDSYMEERMSMRRDIQDIFQATEVMVISLAKVPVTSREKFFLDLEFMLFQRRSFY